MNRENNSYIVSRSFAQVFLDILAACGFDHNLYYKDKEYYEDEIIKIVPYSEWYEMCITDGEPVPDYYDGVHFTYKPFNIKIAWYKYPFRSSRSNQQLDYKSFLDMMVQIANHFSVDKEVLNKLVKHNKKRTHFKPCSCNEIKQILKEGSVTLKIDTNEDMWVGDDISIYGDDDSDYDQGNIKTRIVSLDGTSAVVKIL